jgi:hypothetical protein
MTDQADRYALYARFTQLRADLTVLGNILQSDPAAPRLHTVDDAQKWATEAEVYAVKLESLLTDTHDLLLRTAGNRSRP